MLLAIAILPLTPRCSHWWHSNLNKLLVALALSLATLAFTAITDSPAAALTMTAHTALDEYFPFMVLIGSLYLVAGGLAIGGSLRPTPLTNTAILAAGSLLASVIGTTAASVVLIRLLLETNKTRRDCTHSVVFFIFLVSNIGGLLLPTGDPPLFLGYLKGVPFFWTLALWQPWLLMTALLLIIYFCIDYYRCCIESPTLVINDTSPKFALRLTGSVNLLWLVGIIASAILLVPGKTIPGTSIVAPEHSREGCMVLLALLSLATTPRAARIRNAFSWGPILEVAVLFIGIFLTMQVPLGVLSTRGSELGLSSPAQFFWVTGALSGFLDNAPTYLVFLATATSLPSSAAQTTLQLADGSLVSETVLMAISLGAVFMGAMSYIGNGPNFLVKAIAEESGVKMPGFFGYMAWSCCVLLPLFGLITIVFLG